MLYYLPIFIIVLSNVFYHLASEKVPKGTNPFFFVMISYVVGFAFAAIAFLMSKGDKGLIASVAEQGKMINFTPILLGVAVIGLEVGNVWMYRAGWNISKGALFSNILLAIVLVAVGVMFYKDDFGAKHVAGILSCILGLYLLS